MKLPLPLYIGLRYTRAKRRNRFVSFISFASMLGIALGVIVLITVLSVMNGFDQQIRHHFFALTPQVTVFTQADTLESEYEWMKKIEKFSGVKAAAPFVSGDGLFIKGRELKALTVMGLLPTDEKKISAIAKKMTSGRLEDLSEGSFKLVLDENLAIQLNLKVGDPINLYTSQVTTTPLGLFPRYRQFTIAGVYTDSNNSYAQSKIFINLLDAQNLFSPDFRQSGLHVALYDPFKASNLTTNLHDSFKDLTIKNWTEESGAFFQALAMEKTMMFIILLLVIAIAAFNLVSC